MSLETSRVAASGNAVIGRCRVAGIWVIGGATGGSVTLTDSATTGGLTIAVFDIPGITTTGTTFAGMIPIPPLDTDNGLQFQNGCAVVLSVATAATVIYRLG